MAEDRARTDHWPAGPPAVSSVGIWLSELGTNYHLTCFLTVLGKDSTVKADVTRRSHWQILDLEGGNGSFRFASTLSGQTVVN